MMVHLGEVEALVRQIAQPRDGVVNRAVAVPQSFQQIAQRCLFDDASSNAGDARDGPQTAASIQLRSESSKEGMPPSSAVVGGPPGP